MRIGDLYPMEETEPSRAVGKAKRAYAFVYYI